MSESVAPTCLDEFELLDLSEGVPSEGLRERAEAHLDGCAPCRERLAGFLRARAPASVPDASGPTEVITTEVSGAAPAVSSLPRLSQGTRLGRYVVLERLGAGGMGVVYGAYDPGIDRRIALKLLHAEPGAGETVERRSREAQAAARTQHPHVVAVHDVGTFGECVFIAMELVEGGTLRQHLAAARPSWREVVRLYVQAGRGLAAAHAAGVIHRDFKPENVLVDRTGSVRVTDFGLARMVSAGAPGLVSGSEAVPSGSAPEGGGVRTGGAAVTRVAGTPGYIAPEVLAGQGADARSDQYSFCVALYEGLEGERPPATAGSAQPARSRIPRALRTLLARGLSPEPSGRFGSMEELLEGLERAALPRVRRWGLGAVGVGLLTVAVAVVAVPRPPACQGSAALLSGIWDAPRKQALQRAFMASGAPTASSLFEATSRALDGYAGAWAEAHQQACEATRVRGHQSEAVMDLRMHCLEGRKRELGALADVLMTVDPEGALRAPEATHALGALATCADVEALSRPVPPPLHPEDVPRVEAASSRLAQARALLLTGRWKQSAEGAAAVATEARGLGYKPLLGEALLVEGLAARELRDEKTATERLRSAQLASLAGHDDTHAAEAMVYLVHVEGELAERPEQARLWADQARALLERLGSEPRLEARLLLHEGTALARQGRPAEALPLLQRSLSLQERLEGPEDVSLAIVLNVEGDALKGLGRAQEALELQQRALRLFERSYGPEHPRVALMLNNVGTTLAQLGRYEEALTLQEECLNRMERAHGPGQPPNLIIALVSNLAATHYNLEHFEQSERFFSRGLRLTREHLPPGHPDRVRLGNNLSQLLLSRGRPDEALALLKELHAEEEVATREGRRGSMFAWTFGQEAEVYVRTGRFERGVELARTALGLQKELGAEGDQLILLPLLIQAQLGAGQLAEAHHTAVEALALHHRLRGADGPVDPELNQARGEVLLARGDAAGARILLEQCVADWEKDDATPLTLAAARFSLARALRLGHVDAARQRTLALAARDALAPSPEPRRVSLKALDDFLQTP